MQEQKQQLVTRLKESTNVLVTVSSNPTVDQLAAAIGFTLALNKLKKHATAVFSGEVPSAIEFLDPENTIKKNTDSLRDFIISLDREKADKLRYKVEDKVVRIFISPYKTAIEQSDLQFTQGDFNVDVVIALGVKEQQDLDSAITSHGRILHDATVATVNTTDEGTVGAIHWVDNHASSLSEMLTSLATELHKDVLDNQIATALLTGIVAETDRFSNDKTKPATMAVSSKLMTAGANQQLVSSKLEEAARPPEPELEPEPVNNSQQDTPPEAPQTDEAVLPPPAPQQPPEEPGVLRVKHDDDVSSEPVLDASDLFNQDEDNEKESEHIIHIDEQGKLHNSDQSDTESQDALRLPGSDTPADEHPPIIRKPQNAMVNEPPSGQDDMLTPNANDEDDTYSDPLGDPDAARRNERILNRGGETQNQNTETTPTEPEKTPPDATQTPDTAQSTQAPAPTEQPLKAEEGPQTLQDIEKSVGAHQPDNSDGQATNNSGENNQNQTPPELDEAKKALHQVATEHPQSADEPLPPVEALNAQPVDLNIHPEDTNNSSSPAPNNNVQDPNQPPPVPPPMMPPSQPNQNNNQQQ